MPVIFGGKKNLIIKYFDTLSNSIPMFVVIQLSYSKINYYRDLHFFYMYLAMNLGFPWVIREIRFLLNLKMWFQEIAPKNKGVSFSVVGL